MNKSEIARVINALHELVNVINQLEPDPEGVALLHQGLDDPGLPAGRLPSNRGNKSPGLALGRVHPAPLNRRRKRCIKR